jgi:hypothetical protein
MSKKKKNDLKDATKLFIIFVELDGELSTVLATDGKSALDIFLSGMDNPPSNNEKFRVYDASKGELFEYTSKIGKVSK